MSRHAPLALLSAFALVLAWGMPAPASAGIGNPIKKAKDAVTHEAKKETKSENAKPCAPPVFDDVTIELTEARVSKMIASYQKVEATLAPRQDLVLKRNKLMEERSALWDKHGDKIQDLQGKRQDVDGCIQHGYEVAREKKMEEYSKRAMSDPNLMEKYKELAMKNNAAAAKGDTAAQNNIYSGMYAEMLPSSQDSANVRKDCGPMPPRTKEEDQIDALDKQIASYEDQIRKIDDKVAQTQSKEMGITPNQMGVVMERIGAFNGSSKDAKDDKDEGKKKGESSSSSDKSGSGSSSGSGDQSASGGDSDAGSTSAKCGYTEEETKALTKHAAELNKYFR
ncbi:MAG TPA: hypothetical protein VJX91_05215 [Candidatus Eisenbacteria bacterium]|nr:hypothetical protein [Candidatus Eisenbacteria bacterium]